MGDGRIITPDEFAAAQTRRLAASGHSSASARKITALEIALAASEAQIDMMKRHIFIMIEQNGGVIILPGERLAQVKATGVKFAFKQEEDGTFLYAFLDEPPPPAEPVKENGGPENPPRSD